MRKIVCKATLIRDESGSVLAVGMMLLALLSLLAASTAMTARLESEVSAANRDYKENFYLAEASVMEGIQVLSAADKEMLKTHQYNWSIPDLKDKNFVKEVWNFSGPNTNAAASGVNPQDGAYSVMDKGIAPGWEMTIDSEDEGQEEVHDYAVYGRGRLHIEGNGALFIEVGFRRGV